MQPVGRTPAGRAAARDRRRRPPHRQRARTASPTGDPPPRSRRALAASERPWGCGAAFALTPFRIGLRPRWCIREGGAMPCCRSGLSCCRTEPRRGRDSALAGFHPYRGRPAGLAPVLGRSLKAAECGGNRHRHRDGRREIRRSRDPGAGAAHRCSPPPRPQALRRRSPMSPTGRKRHRLVRGRLDREAPIRTRGRSAPTARPRARPGRVRRRA